MPGQYDALATFGFDLSDVEKGVDEYKAKMAEMTAISKKLGVDLKVVQKVFKDLEKGQGGVTESGGKLEVALRKVARNLGPLGRESNRVSSAIGALGDALGGTVGVIAGVAATTIAAGVAFVKIGSNISDASQNADTSSESFQKLNVAMAGVTEGDTAAKSLNAIATAMRAARDDSTGGIADQLNQVGIAGKDLGGDPTNALFKFLGAMAQIPDRQTRLAKMTEVLKDYNLAVQLDPATQNLPQVQNSYSTANVASDKSIQGAKQLQRNASGGWTGLTNLFERTAGGAYNMLSDAQDAAYNFGYGLTGTPTGERATTAYYKTKDKVSSALGKFVPNTNIQRADGYVAPPAKVVDNRTKAQKESDDKAEKQAKERQRRADDLVDVNKKLAGVESLQELGEKSQLDVLDAQLAVQAVILQQAQEKDEVTRDGMLATAKSDEERSKALAYQSLETEKALVDQNKLVLTHQHTQNVLNNQLLTLQNQGRELQSNLSMTQQAARIDQIRAQHALQIQQATQRHATKDQIDRINQNAVLQMMDARATEMDKTPQEVAAEKRQMMKHARHLRAAIKHETSKRHSGSYVSELWHLKDKNWKGPDMGTDGGQYGGTGMGEFHGGYMHQPNMSNPEGYISSHDYNSKATSAAIEKLNSIAADVLNVTEIRGN